MKKLLLTALISISTVSLVSTVIAVDKGPYAGSTVQGALGEPIEAARSVVQLALNSIPKSDPRYSKLNDAMAALSR